MCRDAVNFDRKTYNLQRGLIMNASRVFNALLTSQLVLLFLLMLAGVGDYAMTDGLHIVHTATGEERAGTAVALVGLYVVAGLVCLATTITSIIGMYCRRMWAKSLYIVTQVVGVFGGLFMVMDVSIVWNGGSILISILDTITGATIAMLFFSPVKHEFFWSRKFREVDND